MQESTLIAIFLVIFGALPCLFSGYFMAINQKRGLISSWKDEWFSNPAQAAKYLGWSLIITAVLVVVIAVLMFVNILDKNALSVTLLPTVLIPIIGFIFIKTKFGKPSS